VASESCVSLHRLLLCAIRKGSPDPAAFRYQSDNVQVTNCRPVACRIRYPCVPVTGEPF
jgi:hypothetical protein